METGQQTRLDATADTLTTPQLTLAEFVATNPAKDNLCRALSSFNVDKLKTSMGFQLATKVIASIYKTWIVLGQNRLLNKKN